MSEPREQTEPLMTFAEWERLHDAAHESGQQEAIATYAATLRERIVAAIDAAEEPCRWDKSDDMPICETHSEAVYGAEGCEDSPAWWQAKAVNAITSALLDEARTAE